MKVWTLMENTTERTDMAAEHGLSYYIETGSHKILFDAGQSGAFADNARQLGIDLSQVDLAILSHGHYDHGGGLTRFLALNDHAPIYLSRHAFSDCHNGTGKYIGLDPALRDCGRLVYTDDVKVLDRGLVLLSCNDRQKVQPTACYGLTVDGKPDPFLHEQYLLVEEQGRRILFSGCSHKGIVNIETWLQPDVLIGGFHFMKLSTEGEDRQVLDQAAEALLQFPTKYYTGHCTGTAQYQYLRQRMGDRLEYLSAGQSIAI